MCLPGLIGGGDKAAPAPPPIPAAPPAPQAPPPPKQVAPAPQSLTKKTDEAGVRPKSSSRERMSIQRGTRQLRIPLNTGGTSSGGLNV